MAKAKIKANTDQRPFSIIYHDFLESELLDTHYQKLVYIYLKKFADSNNQCFPSTKTLAKLTKISVNKVKTTLTELEQKGVISKENRTRPDGGKSSNIYTLYDYSKIWKAGSSEESKEIASKLVNLSDVSTEALIAELNKRDKKKESKSCSPAKVNKDIDTSNIYSNNTSKTDKSQEKYSMEQIKIFFDYDLLVFNPVYKDLGEVVIDILYDVLNTTKDTIRVQGENKLANAVVGKLMKLDYEDIQYAIDKYMAHNEPVKNTKAYLLTLLYNAREQLKLEITNKVACDLSSSSIKNE